MLSPENTPEKANLWGVIKEDISKHPLLVPEHGVELRIASAEYAMPAAALYKHAYERGDYFASRFNNPQAEIFDPEWLAEDFQDVRHLRFVFTDASAALIGATGFFHDRDSSNGDMLLTSDATQIDPAGRGKRIMDRFFKRVVPIIEAAGAGIVTDFVLTPESKGLRRTLQSDLGMVALGIHPHALRHRDLSITRSEISAAKYPNLEPRQASILNLYEPLYRIVQSQLPQLPEPDIYVAKPADKSPRNDFPVSESILTVSASDRARQREALSEGYLPVEYDPDYNQFTVARFPANRPELDFILTNEHITANKRLVGYLKNVLYGSYERQTKGEQL